MRNGPRRSPIFAARDGRGITEEEVVALMGDESYRFLAREPVGRWTVVTAWLGLDQSLGDAERPLIFGTAAIDYSGDLFDDRELYAADEDEALRNHALLVADVTAAEVDRRRET
jgi:hypothetical protein